MAKRHTKLRTIRKSSGRTDNSDQIGKGKNQAPRIQNPNLTISVYVEYAKKQRLNDYAVAKKQHTANVAVASIHSKGHSQLLLRFATKTEANSFENNASLLHALKYTAEISTHRPENSKGVIRGVDINITDEEMIAEFKKSSHYTVNKVVRITRTDQNKQLVHTTTIILEFAGTKLPRSVAMYRVSRIVDIYVPKPTVCFNCQKFGDIAKPCKSSSPVCGFCSDQHDTKECTNDREKDTPCCVNCQGKHNQNCTECPVIRHYRHKFEARVQNTLRTTHFQAPSPRHLNTDFPSLQIPPHLENTGDEPAQIQPQVL